MTSTNETPIYTRFNPRPSRFTADTRRVLVNDRWQRINAETIATLRWLKVQGVSK